MTCVWNDKSNTSPQYDISVRSHTGEWSTYRTHQTPIYHWCGGVTSPVWQVKKLKNKRTAGPLLVLKDSWIDSNRDGEDIVLENILASAENEGQRSFLENCKVTHGDVYVGNKIDRALHGKQMITRQQQIVSAQAYLSLPRAVKPHGALLLERRSSVVGREGSVVGRLNGFRHRAPARKSERDLPRQGKSVSVKMMAQTLLRTRHRLPPRSHRGPGDAAGQA